MHRRRAHTRTRIFTTHLKGAQELLLACCTPTRHEERQDVTHCNIACGSAVSCIRVTTNSTLHTQTRTNTHTHKDTKTHAHTHTCICTHVCEQTHCITDPFTQRLNLLIRLQTLYTLNVCIHSCFGKGRMPCKPPWI